jgi:hypothetical protein
MHVTKALCIYKYIHKTHQPQQSNPYSSKRKHRAKPQS